MGVDPVAKSAQSGLIHSQTANNNDQRIKESGKEKADADSVAAVYEKSTQTPTNAKAYTKDSVTLNGIKEQTEARYASFRRLVESLFEMQAVKTGQGKGLSYDEIMQRYDGNLKSFYQNLEVDQATRANALQDISEEGFWGVKQTSERIIQFAISLSGGDPAKLSDIKAAIEKGFSDAERSWGGALPDICMQTKEAVFKGLDDWAKSVS